MLVLFGDSFTAEWPSDPKNATHSTWFKMLADRLGIEYKTYGERGTSFEYSTLKFFEYLTGDDYDPNDQIIFVLTDSYRSPVVAEEFVPMWAAFTFSKVFPEYFEAAPRQMIANLSESNEHYNRFKNFYKDWFLLKNQDLISAQRYMLLHTLHSLPNNTVSISVDVDEASIAKHFPKHANFSLIEVSGNEFSDGTLWDFITKYGPDDFRLNHLHEKNHHVLTDAVYAYLTDDNFLDFSTSSFHKNLFSVK
jgi:hypothetical protein